MSFADIRIIAIALILTVTYSIFLFLNASVPNAESYEAGKINASDYTTPEASSFWDTVDKIGFMQIQNPELFFINFMLFSTISFLLVFVGLRFLRGTG